MRTQEELDAIIDALPQGAEEAVDQYLHDYLVTRFTTDARTLGVHVAELLRDHTDMNEREILVMTIRRVSMVLGDVYSNVLYHAQHPIIEGVIEALASP